MGYWPGPDCCALFLLSAVWLATQNHSTLVTETTVVPFLPVNPEYSSTRNQASRAAALTHSTVRRATHAHAPRHGVVMSSSRYPGLLDGWVDGVGAWSWCPVFSSRRDARSWPGSTLTSLQRWSSTSSATPSAGSRGTPSSVRRVSRGRGLATACCQGRRPTVWEAKQVELEPEGEQSSCSGTLLLAECRGVSEQFNELNYLKKIK